MKAIITFDCHLEIDIDEMSRNEIAPTSQQVKQLEDILLHECGCERVDITGYHFILVPETC